jgi:hypothetical protein
MGHISAMVNSAGPGSTTLHDNVNHFVRVVAALAIVTGIVSFSYWCVVRWVYVCDGWITAIGLINMTKTGPPSSG